MIEENVERFLAVAEIGVQLRPDLTSYLATCLHTIVMTLATQEI